MQKYQSTKAPEIIQTLNFNANTTAAAQIFSAATMSSTPQKFIVSNGSDTVAAYYLQGNTTAIAATTTTGTIIPPGFSREFKPSVGGAVSLITNTSTALVSVDAVI